jgi:hypothetical protein
MMKRSHKDSILSDLQLGLDTGGKGEQRRVYTEEVEFFHETVREGFLFSLVELASRTIEITGIYSRANSGLKNELILVFSAASRWVST